MDYESQIEQARQRALRYGQQAQYQNPQGQMVGGRYIAPNALQYLASALRAAGGMAGEQMETEQVNKLTKERQTAIADALRNFGQQAQGTPGNVPGDGMGPVLPAQAPDMMGAYQSLLNAPDAGLRQMGTQGMTSLAQQQAEAARKSQDQQRILGILQRAKTPQEALAAGVPAEVAKSYYESRNWGRDKVNWKEVDGNLLPVTEYGETPQGVAPIKKKGNPFTDLLVTDDSGRLVPNAPLVGVKTGLAKSGATRVNVTNKGAEAFDVELAKLDAKQIDAMREKADVARQTLGVAQRLKDAEAKGAYSGTFADQKLAAAGVINSITGTSPKGLVGSELYNAEASKLVLEHVKGLGANPSNADREFIEKTVPRLSTSKQARQQLVNYIEQAAGKTIGQYERMNEYARKNRGLGGYDASGGVQEVDFGSLK